MKVWPVVLVTGVMGTGVGLAPLVLRNGAPSGEQTNSGARWDGDDDDDDDDDDGEEGEAEGEGRRIIRTALPQSTSAPQAATGAPAAAMAAAAAPVSTYTKECGACHVAYPPQLLPARSWDALLANLADHFGDNAELPDATRVELSSWLHANAGDTRGSRVASRIPLDQSPLRITELSWFVGQHDELPSAWVTGNAEIKRWSNCGACHPGAAQGRYGEHEIRIPGHGSWED